jgi:hypothetical protein
MARGSGLSVAEDHCEQRHQWARGPHAGGCSVRASRLRGSHRLCLPSWPSWTQAHPATSPPPLKEAATAYDEKTGDVVLFDGMTPEHIERRSGRWRTEPWRSCCCPEVAHRSAREHILDAVPVGGVREWTNRTVSKTVVVVRPPWVRIPPPPLFERLI